METILFLYEQDQLASLELLLKRYPSARIVSLDAGVEYELARRGISFVSGATLQNRTAPEAYLRADALSAAFSAHKALSLHYRDIPLIEPVRFAIHIYLILLLTYVDIIARALERYPAARLVVPSPTVPLYSSSTGTLGFLGEHEAYVVSEAVRRAAESKGLAFELIQAAPVALRLRNKFDETLFNVKRRVFGFALSVFNSVLALRPRRDIRILASDYWRNIVPVLQRLPEAELVLLDRTEALKAGLRNMWRHKIRCVHAKHYISARARSKARAATRELYSSWPGKEAFTIDAEFRGVSLTPTLRHIAERFVEHALPRLIEDIEAAYAMYEHLHPDVVWVRASVSAQTHFAILPMVARKLNIPSLEPQHGIEYVGEGSATRRHAAGYFAVYGPLVKKEFESIGVSPKHIIAAGSPRFDSYERGTRPTPSDTLRVVSTIPNMDQSERFGSYTAEEHFSALGAALKGVQKAALAVTSRSERRIDFLHEAMRRGLGDFPYEFAGTAPLSKLFANADVFVCSFSTVVYEALMSGLPVVLTAFAPLERLMTEFHFKQFEDAGALIIARTPQELEGAFVRLARREARDSMSAKGVEFMQSNFSFDGKASERIASFIKERAD